MAGQSVFREHLFQARCVQNALCTCGRLFDSGTSRCLMVVRCCILLQPAAEKVCAALNRCATGQCSAACGIPCTGWLPKRFGCGVRGTCLMRG